MKLHISLNTDMSLSITGDIDFFHNNRSLNNWITNRCNSIFTNDGKIIIPKEIIDSDDKIFKFKNSLIKKTKKYDLILEFNKKFKDSIESNIINEDNFKSFCIESEKIWANEYNPDSFQNFCNIIYNKMDRKL